MEVNGEEMISVYKEMPYFPDGWRVLRAVAKNGDLVLVGSPSNKETAPVILQAFDALVETLGRGEA